MKKLFTLLIFLISLQGNSQSSIDLYRYWFNGDISGAVTDSPATPQSDFNLSLSVPASFLPDGLHTFHIRFRDDEKRWSSTVSKFFYKMPVSSITENSVQQYQYWFNNDREAAVTAATAGGGLVQLDETISVAGMADGLHVFHIRFRDGNGTWSSTVSRFFYKMPVTGPIEENLVTAYRYWFNEGDDSMALVELEQAVNPLHLVADIETPYLAPGMHAMNIQFLDLNRQWSSVLTEEFEIVDCSPRFIGNPEGAAEVCGGTNESYQVDAALNITDFQWTLTPAEAGTVSENGSMAGILWSDNFNGEAVLMVQGSNPCGETDAKSIGISIASNPFVTAMPDTAICEGESIALTVSESSGTINWDVEELLVSPLQETTYTVTTTNVCGTATDEVVIGVDNYPSILVMDDVSICEGEQVELTATSDGTVTWSGGSNLVEPTETTTYTATALNGACSAEDDVTVTVNPIPELTMMDDVSICEGEQVVLTAQTDGTLTWDVDNTTVSPNQTTTYFATSLKDGCEVHGEVIITVNYLPELTVMDDVSICEGEQVELSAVTNGILSWSGGAEIVTPMATTVYTATASNICGPVESDVTVTVRPLPSLEVMPDTLICEGEELLLEAESDGVVTWSSGSDLVAPSESVVYTAFAEKDGCEVQKEFLVTVNPVPLTPTLEQDGETLVSSSESGNIWYFNAEELEGVSGQQYSPEATGDYFVRVSSSAGCISDASNIISFVASNLIKIGMNEITVFPNPVQDQLFINPGMNLNKPVRVELLTLGGRVMIIRDIGHESYINVAGLAPSVYILKISLGDESKFLRIIKN
ncbi:MAG: T9SS type A sorting domain-containing protein [Bacteroidales bacterium]